MLSCLPASLHPAVHLIPTVKLKRSRAAIADGKPQTLTLVACAFATNENSAEVASCSTPSCSLAATTARQTCTPTLSGARKGTARATKASPSRSSSSALASSVSSCARIETRRPLRSHPCGQERRAVTLSSAPASTSCVDCSTVHVGAPCVRVDPAAMAPLSILAQDNGSAQWLSSMAQLNGSAQWLLGRIRPGDITVDRSSTDAVLPAASARLAP